jgi:hypothetical protein
VENFPPAQMSVHVATDAVVYKKEVYKAAQNNQADKEFQSVLILVAIRLGISNLNPIYHDALKVNPFYNPALAIRTDVCEI